MKAPSLDRIRALEALLRTRSPASAAVELGITRSSASKTLGQLRSDLNDQLLIRRGDQMILTRRAEGLVTPLGATLGALDRLLEEEGNQAHRTTAAIAMRDECALSLAPALVKHLAAESPHITLKIVPYERDRLAADLAQRTIDIAVAVDPPRDPDLVTALLYRETFVCLNSDRTPLTLEHYLSMGHVTTTSHSVHGGIDAALARNGHRRKIVARVPHVAALLNAAEKGLCATLAARAVLAMRPENLFIHPSPVPIPDFRVCLVWHRRRMHDPETRWLRELVMAAAQR